MLSEISEITEHHAQFCNFFLMPSLRFVCAANCQKGNSITSIPELRWHMFCYYNTEIVSSQSADCPVVVHCYVIATIFCPIDIHSAESELFQKPI